MSNRFLSIAAVSVGLLTATQTFAQSTVDGMIAASSLGSVLAAEKPCGFTYDQTAIQKWIIKHVRDDDMGFAPMLHLMTTGHAEEISEMSSSARTAFCSQSGRVARANGFIQ